jgi:hypothetical protein
MDEYDRNNVAYDGEELRRRYLSHINDLELFGGKEPDIDMRKLPPGAQ